MNDYKVKVTNYSPTADLSDVRGPIPNASNGLPNPTDASGKPVYGTPGGVFSTDPNVLGQGAYKVSDKTPAPTAPVPPGTPATPGSPMDPTQQGYQPAPIAPTSNPIKNIESPATDANGKKYQQTFDNLQQNGGKAPVSSSAARTAVSQATPQTPAPEYTPTPSFMQFADPVMKQFISQALQEKQEITDTGFTANALKGAVGKQIADVDTQLLNLHNIMDGSIDDIRNEINKGGGFATESQVQALAITRNKDLLRQYNSLEIQKQNMQNQLQMNVQLAEADHQHATDNFNNTMQAYQLYDGIKKNATTQLDQLVNRVGYSGLATAYNNDPNALALAETGLGLPQGSLSDPNKLGALETYRQKTLNLSASRFNAIYGYPGSSSTGTSGGTEGPTGGEPTGTGGNVGNNPNASYAQYGLLSKTDFNPKNDLDSQAANYIDVYLNNGKVPSATQVGIRGIGNIAMKRFTDVQRRAQDLIFDATGQNLPSPQVVAGKLKLITANNTLANNLRVQENTVKANFGLSLENLNANNLNTAWPILNNAINYIKNAEGDPDVAQYFAQNSTIQQELGNLLAVKNASGTTVYDKIKGAGLIPPNATPEQQVKIVKTLLQEAQNAGDAIQGVNSELYKAVDPLQRQAENPNRQGSLHTTPTLMDLRANAPKGQILIKRNGQSGYIPEGEFDSKTDTKL